MKEKSLDTFGRLIVNQFVDQGIERFINLQQNKLKSPSTEWLRENLSSLDESQTKIVEKLVVDVLTSATHDFLFALAEAHEDGHMEINIQGVNVLDMSDGLAGELFGEAGWLSRFSQHAEIIET